MNRKLIAENLKHTILFQDASAAELISHAELARVQMVPQGQYVYQEGDSSETFYVIASGKAELILPRDGETNSIVGRIGRGDISVKQVSSVQNHVRWQYAHSLILFSSVLTNDILRQPCLPTTGSTAASMLLWRNGCGLPSRTRHTQPQNNGPMIRNQGPMTSYS